MYVTLHFKTISTLVDTYYCYYYSNKKDTKWTIETEAKLRQETFTTKCVLMFPLPGLFSVTVRCKLIDVNNTCWVGGQETVIQVKVSEDDLP